MAGRKTAEKGQEQEHEESQEKGGALARREAAALPAEVTEELLADAGAGTSSSVDDNIVPFVVLLQDLSPEVKKRDPAYVQGAEVGMLLNRATKQLYASDPKQAEETGLPMLLFQHCAFDRCVVEWVPRVDGGGFVARHPLEGRTPEQTMGLLGGKQISDPNDPGKKIWRTADGKHDLIDTRYHFGHILSAEDGTIQPAVLSFSSTGHTASREWMTMMNNFKLRNPRTGALVVAPAWSKWYTVGTRAKSNNKGDFFVISVSDGGLIEDAGLRAAGKAMYASVTSGALRAAQEEGAMGAGDEGGGEDTPI